MFNSIHTKKNIFVSVRNTANQKGFKTRKVFCYMKYKGVFFARN